MDIDTIKKMIQDFFEEGTVTIVGSGLSLAEGIPGMGELANELRAKMPGLLSVLGDIINWESIDNDLVKGVGLEEALHNTKPSEYVEECIRKVTAMYIGEEDRNLFIDIVKNGKQLRFSEYLQRFNIKNQGMTVITTNYDRLIEYACEMNDIMVDTLFTGKYIARFKPDQSKYASCIGTQKMVGKKIKLQYSPRVTVLKPHGCLSWHLVNGIPYSVPDYSMEDSLIITPGLNKYREGYSVPFDTHRARANEEIDKAQRYIIIGYGFGDDHLETHLMQQLHAGKPALIFTYSLSAKAEKVVKECNGITAFYHTNSNDTKVLNSTGETILSGVNLWDLHEMIKEVF
ncbi:MAG: SIR2 family protein [Lachnospiraceae bacterium]|nr:SIR2 family protein [Lachnospiraceae bacterium]